MQDKFLVKTDENFEKIYELVKLLVDEVKENNEWTKKVILQIEDLDRRVKVLEG